MKQFHNESSDYSRIYTHNPSMKGTWIQPELPFKDYPEKRYQEKGYKEEPNHHRQLSSNEDIQLYKSKKREKPDEPTVEEILQVEEDLWNQ
jgi:hypothetical protein